MFLALSGTKLLRAGNFSPLSGKNSRRTGMAGLTGPTRPAAPASLSRRTDLSCLGRMTCPSDPRPARRVAACLLLGAFVLWANLAAAQGVSPIAAFTSLPSLAWPQPAGGEESRWAGAYA